MVQQTEAFLMEIPEVPRPPLEYQSFFYRRLFWKELGRHYDAMTHAEAEEAIRFMELEQQHPQRFQAKDKN